MKFEYSLDTAIRKSREKVSRSTTDDLEQLITEFVGVVEKSFKSSRKSASKEWENLFKDPNLQSQNLIDFGKEVIKTVNSQFGVISTGGLPSFDAEIDRLIIK